MDLLKELHAEGSTILMVTHDPRYSRYAERTIHLFDGRVVREESRANPTAASGVSMAEAIG
jgi:putative ABC transport system ATP-binding protein